MGFITRNSEAAEGSGVLHRGCDHAEHPGAEAAGGWSETPAGPGCIVIDCDDCVMQRTRTCEECVVTHLLGRSAGEALVVGVAEVRALQLLSGAGLAVPLRHRRLGAPN